MSRDVFHAIHGENEFHDGFALLNYFFVVFAPILKSGMTDFIFRPVLLFRFLGVQCPSPPLSSLISNRFTNSIASPSGIPYDGSYVMNFFLLR